MSSEARACRDALLVSSRIRRWADRLTRHAEASELIALNADPRFSVPIGPTLAAVLAAARDSAVMSEGLVDVAMLDERLAAEGLLETPPAPRPRIWSLTCGPRRTATVARPAGLRFDFGGVAKGWIADRALELLHDWPSAVVDADGDLAIRTAPGEHWEVAVDDPRNDDVSLAILRLAAPRGRMPVRWGVATSGTSIHRWSDGGTVRHHLIDPRTGLPAVTDVVQATVVAGTSLRAEALAKAAVIAGSAAGLALLDRAGVRGAIVLTERGETLALPPTLALIAG